MDSASPPAFRFHHVGVVTRELRDTTQLYERLGYQASATFEDPLQKAFIILMHRGDGPMVELVAPMDPTSPSMGWVKRIQAGPYHTCYETAELGGAIAWWKTSKVFPVAEPVPAVAFDMRRVVFLWGERIGLLELLESAG